MTTASTPVAPALLQQALEWQVTLWSGEVSREERISFERWLAADPAHALAWAQVRHTDEQLQALAPAGPAAAGALRAAGTTPRGSRRAVLGAAGLLAGAGVAALAVRQTPQWQLATADHSTARGQRRDIALPDGTHLTLGSATAIDLRYGATERLVLLRAGEVFITTATDVQTPARPFLVQTAEGRVRAIGTQFGVRQSSGHTRVAVQQGAVEIHPAQGGVDALLRLDAGQQSRFSRTAVEPPRPLDPNATAWTRGLLVAERMRLEDVVAELGRHRGGVLRCDPAVAGLAVSGVYSLDDTVHALQAIAQALPVRVRAATRWWVTVGPL